LNKFNEQLGDMINLMVNGLRAGYSTMQAMEAVSKELPPPICDEFHRVVQEMQVGIPMEGALEISCAGIPSEDLDFLSLPLMFNVRWAATLLKSWIRFRLQSANALRSKGEIRVLTSQVRASGTLLSLVPVVLALIIWFIDRLTSCPLWMTVRFVARPIAGLVLFMIGLGYFIMQRIADIEV